MMVNYTTESEKAWYKSPAIVDVGCVARNNLELNRKSHSDAPYRMRFIVFVGADFRDSLFLAIMVESPAYST
jgi:hypothetical protein